MQDSYRKFKNYCTYNRLQPNSKKTHFMQIESSQRRGIHGSIPELCFNGEMVKASLDERILGVQVSSRLNSWKEKTDKVIRDVNKVMGGLKMGGTYLNFKQRLATVRACYLSKLFYSIEVWGHGLTKNQIQSLQVAQNKILRWVTKLHPEALPSSI